MNTNVTIKGRVTNKQVVGKTKEGKEIYQVVFEQTLPVKFFSDPGDIVGRQVIIMGRLSSYRNKNDNLFVNVVADEVHIIEEKQEGCDVEW
jgi:single-stranded DNA-binding protein